MENFDIFGINALFNVVEKGVNHYNYSDLHWRAKNAFDQENYSLAISYYSEIINSHRKEFNAYFNRAYSRSAVKDDQGAVEDYTEAIKINPGSANAYNNRGNAYEELSQYQQAINDYTRAINLDFTLTIARNNLNRIEEGITLFNNTLTLIIIEV